MPTENTFGRLLVGRALPPGVPRPTGPLDKKSTAALFQALAEVAPEHYRSASKSLSDIGAEASYLTGGYSFGPEHLRSTPEIDAARGDLAKAVRSTLADSTLSDKARNDKLVHLALAHTPKIQSAVESSTRNNPLSMQVVSGAKGKMENLKSLLAGDTLYLDSEYNPIPFPVTSSFYEGLRPHEYAGGTFGARLAISLTKLGTAQGGYLAKRLKNLTHRLVVTDHDAQETNPDDPPTGLKTNLSDPDNEGAALAHDIGGFPRNTILTRKVIGDLKRQGLSDVMVRSPMVGGPADGGVYGLDVGVRERNHISPRGDQVGLAASDALAEPVTQTIIGCLARGTMVRMADGSTKTIEEIAIGDIVLGADVDGRTAPATVTRTFDNGTKDCWCYRFSRGFVVCTPDHKVVAYYRDAVPDIPVLLRTRIRPISNFVDGEIMVRTDAFIAQPDGGFKYVEASEISVTDYHPGTPTYDIEVDNEDHLFVLANGLIVSNSKHSGGVAGATKGQQGFPVLDKLLSIPSDYGGAVHAENDGVLSSVRKAPQGGQYVTIGGVDHYVPADRAVTAGHGDKIEAGDPLTDGLENPAKYVEHKGIGEARKRFVDAFMKASQDAGFRPHRRNLELVARGYMDSVELNQETDHHVPGDIVSYTELAHHYRPRDGHKRVAPKDGIGSYLERPALHHTIGTRVTPRVAEELSGAGINTIPVHPNPPPFTPLAIRSHDKINFDEDPLTRMLGTGLERTFLKGVARGDTSDLKGTSFVPALAEGASFNAPESKTRAWQNNSSGPPG